MEFELKDFEWMWRNNGELPASENKERMSLADALSVTNAPVFLPRVMQNIVKEAAEPLLVGTSLLQRINYQYGSTISFPAMGAFYAADIAEGQEYPEQTPSLGGANVTATIGKVGLAVKVTEEMVRYSQFDVIGMMLRAAGRAMARHKEKKIFDYLNSMGTVVFDNVNPGSSLKGVCTGRSLNGAGNGSCTMDDVFDTYAQLVTQGFTPNTILMHPLAWTMWIKDPILRAFALSAGGGTYFASWTGNPAGRAPWDNSSQGGLGAATGQNITPGGNAAGLSASPLLDYPQNINSAPVLPSYLGLPFTIVVSPFVPYNPRRKLTDIYMLDRNEAGALVVDEDLMVESFNDPRVDIQKIKMRERYAIAVLQEGQAIATMKNVHVVPNNVVLPAFTSLDVSANVLGDISPTASVL